MPKGYELFTFKNVTVRVHTEAGCSPPCAIHAPTNHHMRMWPMIYRTDRGIIERQCEHDVGHPDPDDYRVRHSVAEGVHGCDGCCAPEKSMNPRSVNIVGDVGDVSDVNAGDNTPLNTYVFNTQPFSIDNYIKPILNKINAHMKENNVTVPALAAHLGLTDSSVQYVLNGSLEVSKYMLFEIMHALNMSMSTIFSPDTDTDTDTDICVHVSDVTQEEMSRTTVINMYGDNTTITFHTK